MQEKMKIEELKLCLNYLTSELSAIKCQYSNLSYFSDMYYFELIIKKDAILSQLLSLLDDATIEIKEKNAFPSAHALKTMSIKRCRYYIDKFASDDFQKRFNRDQVNRINYIIERSFELRTGKNGLTQRIPVFSMRFWNTELFYSERLSNLFWFARNYCEIPF